MIDPRLFDAIWNSHAILWTLSGAGTPAHDKTPLRL
jgi:hypothetical protein